MRLMNTARVQKQEQGSQADEDDERRQVLVYELYQEIDHLRDQVQHKKDLIEHLELMIENLRHQLEMEAKSERRDEKISIMPSGKVYHFSRKCDWFAKGKWHNACSLCKRLEGAQPSHEGSMSDIPTGSRDQS